MHRGRRERERSSPFQAHVRRSLLHHGPTERDSMAQYIKEEARQFADIIQQSKVVQQPHRNYISRATSSESTHRTTLRCTRTPFGLRLHTSLLHACGLHWRNKKSVESEIYIVNCATTLRCGAPRLIVPVQCAVFAVEFVFFSRSTGNKMVYQVIRWNWHPLIIKLN